jgi:hypothetical protein
MHYSEQAQPETEDDIEGFETKRIDVQVVDDCELT